MQAGERSAAGTADDTAPDATRCDPVYRAPAIVLAVPAEPTADPVSAEPAPDHAPGEPAAGPPTEPAADPPPDGPHDRVGREGAVTGVRRGGSADEEFTAFVTANYARLRHVADLMTGADGNAEDILQNVLTRTYLRWGTIRQDNPLGYVRAALANARTDWWRRPWTRERPAGMLPDTRTEPDHSGEVAGRDAMQRALGVLTRRERSVIVLRFYEDLSEAEIARTLGIAPGTVKSACSRALTKLRVSPDLACAAGDGEHPARSTEDRS